MSEEEKEAIESLKKLVQLRKNKRGEIKHDTCIYSTKDLEIALNLIQKQDKIIDEMVKFIKNNISENKIIKEVCIKGKCKNEECHEDDIAECIKQYFARKVKKENL